MIKIPEEEIKCLICGKEPHYCEECHHNTFHNAHISLLQRYMKFKDPLKEIKRILYNEPKLTLSKEELKDKLEAERYKILDECGLITRLKKPPLNPRDAIYLHYVQKYDEKSSKPPKEEHWKVDLKEVFEGLVGVKIPYNIIIKIDSFREKYKFKDENK